ncbi:hypothetical protein H0R92_01270 [Treponema sp. OMZ 840]|uniref:hypothetical protein n=1 Tax=Treponema sp. OMZ 840 TaxID=244313 RepID=UPI003D91242B
MIQFYLLSVVLNAASGLLLVFSKQIPEDAAETSAAGLSFFETKNFRLILGILTIFTGIMKLLTVVQGDIPVLGDLIPALAGICAGLCLLYEYYKASASVSFTLPAFFEKIFIDGRKYMGIFCIVIATLHFIFPRVLFL